LGFRGLAKLDLATRSVRLISKKGYVHGLALTADGRSLYVAYEAGGPGGSFGHDAIGYFDTATDRLAGAIKGFPNVGTALSLAPDGSQVWENGADACDSPQYDHVGCPAVPAGLINIISTADNKLARAVALRGGRVQGITFSPDGVSVAIGLTNALLLVRSKDFAVTASLPVGSTGRLAFTPDGLKAYSPVNGRPTVAVIQIQLGVEVRALRLTDREDRDQTLTLAQVRHESGQDWTKPFRISSGSGRVCTTFAIKLKMLWQVDPKLAEQEFLLLCGLGNAAQANLTAIGCRKDDIGTL
jgi:DNA-binding beta-propeller fold protein YncE